MRFQLHFNLPTHVLEHHILRSFRKSVILLDQLVKDRTAVGLAAPRGRRHGHQFILIRPDPETRIGDDVRPQLQEKLPPLLRDQRNEQALVQTLHSPLHRPSLA